MNKIILIGLLLILLYLYINRGNMIGSYEPSQKEIQNLDYVRDKEEIIQVDELGEFPTPHVHGRDGRCCVCCCTKQQWWPLVWQDQ